MDPTLAAAATAAAAYITPYLPKLAESAAEKIGEGIPAAAGSLFGWLRGQLSSGGTEAMDALAKAPEDAHEQETLKRQIAKALSADPALLDELRALLPAEAAAPLVSQTQTVSGDDAKAVQSAGNNNIISIG